MPEDPIKKPGNRAPCCMHGWLSQSAPSYLLKAAFSKCPTLCLADAWTVSAQQIIEDKELQALWDPLALLTCRRFVASTAYRWIPLLARWRSVSQGVGEERRHTEREKISVGGKEGTCEWVVRKRFSRFLGTNDKLAKARLISSPALWSPISKKIWSSSWDCPAPNPSVGTRCNRLPYPKPLCWDTLQPFRRMRRKNGHRQQCSCHQKIIGLCEVDSTARSQTPWVLVPSWFFPPSYLRETVMSMDDVDLVSRLLLDLPASMLVQFWVLQTVWDGMRGGVGQEGYVCEEVQHEHDFLAETSLSWCSNQLARGNRGSSDATTLQGSAWGKGDMLDSGRWADGKGGWEQQLTTVWLAGPQKNLKLEDVQMVVEASRQDSWVTDPCMVGPSWGWMVRGRERGCMRGEKRKRWAKTGSFIYVSARPPGKELTMCVQPYLLGRRSCGYSLGGGLCGKRTCQPRQPWTHLANNLQPWISPWNSGISYAHIMQ